MKINNYVDLQHAIDENEKLLELDNSFSVPNSIKLHKGQKLFSTKENIFLSFISGDGVALTGDNEVSGLSIQTSPSNRAIYIDSSETNLGTIRLENLTITGAVQLLTRAPNKTLSLALSAIDIVSADARHYPERPMKYGVNVYQGALTIYNFNPETDSRIAVHAEHIGVGREKAPVIGSGIFISGFNDTSGPVVVDKLTTNGVYSNGMIPTGQPNLITGGIFIVYGVEANEVVSLGEVTTYGTNDMVLDVWGSVKSWVVKENVTSYGASGIGFVNFGDVDYFKSEKTIKTYGLGARGFNQYDGTIKDAFFERITTVGNGSIGMQFSKPVGNITIGSGIETLGSKGQTLVKGEIVELNADAISVLHGGLIEELTIDGDVVTSGDHVVSYHINGGVVQSLNLGGKLVASGEGAKPVVIEHDGHSASTGLEDYLS